MAYQLPPVSPGEPLQGGVGVNTWELAATHLACLQSDDLQGTASCGTWPFNKHPGSFSKRQLFTLFAVSLSAICLQWVILFFAIQFLVICNYFWFEDLIKNHLDHMKLFFFLVWAALSSHYFTPHSKCLITMPNFWLPNHILIACNCALSGLASLMLRTVILIHNEYVNKKLVCAKPKHCTRPLRNEKSA